MVNVFLCTVSDPTADEQSGYLGWEVDVFTNWRVTSDLAVTVRYGAFFPGDAFSDIVLFTISPVIAAVALKMGPIEIFALMVFAFSVIAGLVGDSMAKGIASAGFGLFCATVGLDPEKVHIFLQSMIPAIAEPTVFFSMFVTVNMADPEAASLRRAPHQPSTSPATATAPTVSRARTGCLEAWRRTKEAEKNP